MAASFSAFAQAAEVPAPLMIPTAIQTTSMTSSPLAPSVFVLGLLGLDSNSRQSSGYKVDADLNHDSRSLSGTELEPEREGRRREVVCKVDVPAIVAAIVVRHIGGY